jgi:protein-L-isoaspartate(D-aspartate) O-methyltransferase
MSCLDVGSGPGAVMRLMAERVGPQGRVTGIELDPELAARSRDNLAPYGQVEVMAGDGAQLTLTDLDGLYINAGATHPLDCWLDALAPGGRLVLPLTQETSNGLVVKITRLKNGFGAAYVSSTGIFHCAGARDPAAAERLKEALADWEHKPWRKLRSLRRDAHQAEEGCWLHGDGYCFSLRAPDEGSQTQ